MKQGHACYHSAHNVSVSNLLSKNTKFNLYSTAISPVLSYGCETWCFRFRNKHRLRVLENMVLRNIFGPKNKASTRERRRLCNEKLCDLYFIAFINGGD